MPNCLPSGQRQVTHIFGDAPEAPGERFFLRPPYSPNLAPSDYHLFLSMANALGSLKLATREFCENWLTENFANRKASFYKVGIMKLASRW